MARVNKWKDMNDGTKKMRAAYELGRNTRWDTPLDLNVLNPFKIEPNRVAFEKGRRAAENEIQVFFGGLSIAQFKALTEICTYGD